MMVCGVCGRLIVLEQGEGVGVHREAIQFCSVSCIHEFLVNRSNGIDSDYERLVEEGGRKALTAQDAGHAYFSPVLHTHFRSVFEGTVAEVLSRKWRLRLEYEPHQFMDDMSGKIYIPDFWLPERHVWVEVKGPWSLGSKKLFGSMLSYMGRDRLLLIPWRFRVSFFKQARALGGAAKIVR